MKDISLRQALATNAPRRTRDYEYRAGDFALSVSFRDAKISQSSVRLAGELSKVFTQANVARIMGCSLGIAAKLVRIWRYQQEGQ